jgi:hypothetical protein
MHKRLLLLTRLLVLAAASSALLALAVSGPASPEITSTPVLTGRWDSIHDTDWPSAPHSARTFYLIDRQSGRCLPMPLPVEDRWTTLSVSPWSAEEGGGDAVGLCSSLHAQSGHDGFLGLALLRLPEARVVERLPMDVLPTSRPCWVPDRPGSILFAAGDGQLYRHNFASVTGSESDPESNLTGEVAQRLPQPLAWKCRRPAERAVYLTDPAWPAHPRLRRFIVATLIAPTRRHNGEPARDTSLWWLRMHHDGMTIESCGQLLGTDLTDPQSPEEIRRFPTLTVASAGEIRLVYLAHDPGKSSGRIMSTQIQVGEGTGQPRVLPGTHSVIAENCASVPPVVSADGKSVYCVSLRSGLVTRFPVDPVAAAPRPITVARRD